MYYFDHAFIDMDGVLCDLQKGVLEEHGRLDLHPLQDFLRPGTLGVSREGLWEPVVDASPDFWKDLEIYPWAHELVDFATKIAREVTILTRPLVIEGSKWGFRETGLCVEGKLKWLHKHFDGVLPVVFTDRKNTVSKPGVLLIDDDEAYEAAFTAAGGHQFLWPQPYNRYKQYIGKEMQSAFDWYKRLSDRKSNGDVGND